MDTPVERAGVQATFFNLFILWKSLVNYSKVAMRRIQKKTKTNDGWTNNKNEKPKTYNPSWMFVKIRDLIKYILKY